MPEPNETEIALLNSFNLSESQSVTALRAFEDAPQGLIIIALECRRYGAARGNSGAGLLIHRIARGEHFDAQMDLEPKRQRRTGWRRVRGTHGTTYVQDPDGTDEPPSGN